MTENLTTNIYQNLVQNLESGKCGLQVLIVHLQALYSKSPSHFENHARNNPGLKTIFYCWMKEGRPTHGLWGRMLFFHHAEGCSCEEQFKDR